MQQKESAGRLMWRRIGASKFEETKSEKQVEGWGFMASWPMERSLKFALRVEGSQ